MIGKTISHYKILGQLGEGGMGVIYKAEDTKLKRPVALKFLSPKSLGTQEEKTRFIREAQAAAAALDHPNICTVHEIDEADGHIFIAMALIEGGTLRDKITSGPLKIDEALDIAVEVAQGLQEAHEKDVVHRDIKSGNIMITPKGQAKITDFGLAKLADHTQVTEAGTTVGTVSFMSPEQTRGDDVDRRSDIWSLGVVLYQMITGLLPFRGDHEAAVANSIMNELPEPMTGLRVGVPMELERIVQKALAKNRDERYQHVDEMLVDLRAVRTAASSSTHATPILQRRGRSPLLVGGVVALLVVVIGVIAMWQLNRNPEPAATGETSADTSRPSIAVLPLENLSGDSEQEYFADGMTEAVITQLAQISGLKVISRTSVMRYKGTTKPLPEVAAELGVNSIVEGSVLLVGDRVRITAQLIDGSTDEHLWAESYERDLSDVLELQGQVARTIALEIEVQLTPREQARLSREHTVDPEAYQLYLQGLYHWNKRTPAGLQKSIELFQRAVDKDPGYALAYAGSALAHLVAASWSVLPPGDAYPKARELAKQALAIDRDLGEAHAALGGVLSEFDWDWSEGERELGEAIQLSPGFATAYQWSGENLIRAGKPDKALVMLRKAQELDPLSMIINSLLGICYARLGDFDRAMAQFQRVIDLDPQFPPVYAHLASMYILRDMREEAVSATINFLVYSGRGEEQIAELRQARSVSGPEGFYRKEIELEKARAASEYVSPVAIAMNYSLLGEKDSAFVWLEKGYEEHSPALPFMTFFPHFEVLRSDPRYADMLRRIGLEP